MTLWLLAALAAVVAVFVIQPVFARPGTSAAPPALAGERRRLLEKKERLYEAIRDLDFEREAGKLSEEDHRRVRAEYLGEAAAVLAKLEELEAAAKTTKRRRRAAPGETAGAAAAAASASPPPASAEPAEEKPCGACGRTNPAHARFCLECGARFETARTCPECGESLPDEARFCTACGVAIPA